MNPIVFVFNDRRITKKEILDDSTGIYDEFYPSIIIDNSRVQLNRKRSVDAASCRAVVNRREIVTIQSRPRRTSHDP